MNVPTVISTGQEATRGEDSRHEVAPDRVVGDLRLLIADTLDLDPDEVVPTLGLHDVPEWSSLDHITLMIALEERLDRAIDGPLTAELTSVAAIEAWATRSGAGPESGPETDTSRDAEATASTLVGLNAGANATPTIHRGLDGVVIDTSTITAIDGAAGTLTIRGYTIDDLADHADLLDVVHLVLEGSRPTPAERAHLANRLLAPPALAPSNEPLFATLVDHHPMVALRTAISLLGRGEPEARARSAATVVDRGIDLTAWSYQILSRHLAANLGHSDGWPASAEVPEPTSRFAVAGAFLANCFGTEPHPIEAEALDLIWRLQVDHGSNASTFSARVTAAAGTDVDAALVAGLATFAGALHGGAVQGVIEGLREIGSPDVAAAWVDDRRSRRQPIMGYGHRVYKVVDPRSGPLRTMAARLADHCDDHWALDMMHAVERAMAPYERAGLGMNVDSYASVLYHLLGFPDRYHTALYAAARTIGWVAHVAEQVEANVLIRPRLAYTGPDPRPWAADDDACDEAVR